MNQILTLAIANYTIFKWKEGEVNKLTPNSARAKRPATANSTIY
ncbi:MULTISPECIES: hypothetical protein [unclassified Nostoc]|nr:MULTISPECIES: hypothetical protein [unclassified Nostoc]